MKATLRVVAASLVIGLAGAGLAVGQETMAEAKQLYAAASYDEALATLDHLKTTTPPESSDSRAIEEYRVLCLLALGRQADAERGIEALVAADPSFSPDVAVASPRVQGVFADVRKRLVPNAARERYLSGKAAFERKDYEAAVRDFEMTLHWIDAPDLAALAKEGSLADLRMLALGFRDLARAAATPPPPPAPPPAPVASPKPEPPAPRYYTPDDAGVVPPVAISQHLPPWPPAMPMPTGASSRGLIEVFISETGTVDSVRILRPTVRYFDERLVDATKSWRFKPATRNGVAVGFCRVVEVAIEN
jgi:TonB family protein